MGEKYRGTDDSQVFRPNVEANSPEEVLDVGSSARLRLQERLRASRVEPSQEFSIPSPLEGRDEFLQKCQQVCGGLNHLLERFYRHDVNVRLAEDRELVRQQRNRLAVRGPVVKSELLECYEELSNLFDNFSSVDFPVRDSSRALVEEGLARLPELTKEVDRLIGRGQSMAEPSMITGSIERPLEVMEEKNQERGRLKKSGQSEAGAKLAQAVAPVFDSQFEKAMPTIEFEVPAQLGAKVPSPVSTPAPARWWKRAGIRSLVAGTALLGADVGVPLSDTLGGRKDMQQPTPLHIPSEVPPKEPRPEYGIFWELEGVKVGEKKITLPLKNLERSLYWVFLDSAKERNITNRSWVDKEQMEDHCNWAAKKAVALLVEGKSTKRLRQLVNIKVLNEATDQDADHFTIKDRAVFYDVLIKPLLSFERNNERVN